MIYNRLAVIRAAVEISRKELATKMGVNPQTIDYIERGDYFPSLELAFKQARVLSTSITTMFSDEQLKNGRSE